LYGYFVNYFMDLELDSMIYMHIFKMVFQLTRGNVGLVERGGGGGGCFLAGCIGVCKACACVYNSSSDDDGDEDNEESLGELKGFDSPTDSFVGMEKTPLG
jgi:hypothetical protein